MESRSINQLGLRSSPRTSTPRFLDFVSVRPEGLTMSKRDRKASFEEYDCPKTSSWRSLSRKPWRRIHMMNDPWCDDADSASNFTKAMIMSYYYDIPNAGDDATTIFQINRACRVYTFILWLVYCCPWRQNYSVLFVAMIRWGHVFYWNCHYQMFMTITTFFEIPNSVATFTTLLVRPTW